MGINKITVKSGDTLSKIAQQTGKSTSEIIALNKDTITDPNKIYVGQEIKISNEIETVDLSLPKAELKSNLGVNTPGDKRLFHSSDAQALNNNPKYETHQQILGVETKKAMASNAANSYADKKFVNDILNKEMNEAGIREAKPEDFHFELEDSNILAAKGRNLGFTDDQIRIAIAISRWETGHYEHLAYGNNYGGVTSPGDLGIKGGYGVYSTKDLGMDAYLNNLKKNYFDKGLNSIESIAPSYKGKQYDPSEYIRNVKSIYNKTEV